MMYPHLSPAGACVLIPPRPVLRLSPGISGWTTGNFSPDAHPKHGWALFMSIKLISAVWESDLAAHLKPIASVLADKASEDGSSVFPSVAYCAWQLSTNERTERRHFSELRALGVIRAVCHEACVEAPGSGHGRGNPVVYHFDALALPAREPWDTKGGNLSPFPMGKGGTDAERGALQYKRGASDRERGARTTPDPSSDPSFLDPSSDPSERDHDLAGNHPEAKKVYAHLIDSGIQSFAPKWAERWMDRGRSVPDIIAAIDSAVERGAGRKLPYIDAILENPSPPPKRKQATAKPYQPVEVDDSMFTDAEKREIAEAQARLAALGGSRD